MRAHSRCAACSNAPFQAHNISVYIAMLCQRTASAVLCSEAPIVCTLHLTRCQYPVALLACQTPAQGANGMVTEGSNSSSNANMLGKGAFG
eukprot:261117-Pelagomonas_calceolata.AAC.3